MPVPETAVAPLDLGDPRLRRLIVRLALPTVAGLGISALHHVVNAAFVGMLGPTEIAAVSIAPPGPSTRGERIHASRYFAVAFSQTSKPFFQLSQPIIVVLRCARRSIACRTAAITAACRWVARASADA